MNRGFFGAFFMKFQRIFWRMIRILVVLFRLTIFRIGYAVAMVASERSSIGRADSFDFSHFITGYGFRLPVA